MDESWIGRNIKLSERLNESKLDAGSRAILHILR
jgi:hypothetical protein